MHAKSGLLNFITFLCLILMVILNCSKSKKKTLSKNVPIELPTEKEMSLRNAWQLPNKILEVQEFQEAQSIAEIGAGLGYFTLRILREFPNKTLWASDINPLYIHYLFNKKKILEAEKFFPHLSAKTSPLIPEKTDLIFMVNLLHVIEEPKSYLNHLKNYLNVGGKIIIIDYKIGTLPVGPSDNKKLSLQILKDLVKEANMKVIKEYNFLPYQNFLVVQPSE